MALHNNPRWTWGLSWWCGRVPEGANLWDAFPDKSGPTRWPHFPCGSELAREDNVSDHDAVVDVLASSRASSLPHWLCENANSVGASLLAKALFQPMNMSIEIPIRGQASLQQGSDYCAFLN